MTTSPDELEQIMKWMRVPRDVVFAFVTAVRFIPVVMLDAFQIMDAQKSRGLEFEKGNVLRRVRNLVPILIPLVVNSVIRSGELAEAMESRAYGSTPKPTSLYGMRLRWYDVAVVVVSLLLFSAVALYIYHFISFRSESSDDTSSRRRGRKGEAERRPGTAVEARRPRLLQPARGRRTTSSTRRSRPRGSPSGDFVSSVYDGRLFAQASALASSYRKPYIIVEGDVNQGEPAWSRTSPHTTAR